MTDFQSKPTPSAPNTEDHPRQNDLEDVFAPIRQRLPDTRNSITHKFKISGCEGYIIVGLLPNGDPGEIFLKVAKQGSTLAGLLNTVGILTSLCLQYGVPVQDLARKFESMHFEPSGWTPNPEIKEATSIVDYIFRWLNLTFPSHYSATEGDNAPLSANLPALESAEEGKEHETG